MAKITSKREHKPETTQAESRILPPGMPTTAPRHVPGRDYGILSRLPWSPLPSLDASATLWGCTIDLCSPEGQELADAIFGRTKEGIGLPDKSAEREEHQRMIDWKAVEEYAKAAREGRWKLTGQSLILTARDGLACSHDGQHRFASSRQAVAWYGQQTASGRKVERPRMPTVLLWNPEPSTFDAIDTGKGRTGKDHLSIAGVPDEYTAIAAESVATLLSHVEGSARRNSVPAKYRVTEVITANPGLLASAAWALSLEQTAKSVQSALTGVMYPSFLLGALSNVVTYDYLLGQWDCIDGQNESDVADWISQYQYDPGIIKALGDFEGPFGIGIGEEHATRQGAYRSLVQRLVWGKYPPIQYAKKGSIRGGVEIETDTWFMANGHPLTGGPKTLIEDGEPLTHIAQFRDELERRMAKGSEGKPDQDSRKDCFVPLLAYALSGDDSCLEVCKKLSESGRVLSDKTWCVFRPKTYLQSKPPKGYPEGIVTGMRRIGGYDVPPSARADRDNPDMPG